jgi:predicted ArsR family transcriptional regulator
MRAKPSDGTAQSGLTASRSPQRGVGLADVRAANRACILATLEREGPLSRIALARLVGLSRTTVGSIVADLLREGRLREVGMLPAAVTGGRRAVLLLLSDERASRD